MGSISGDEYFDLVIKGFGHLTPGETREATYFTEDIFKVQWLANLRLITFITIADEIDFTDFNRYIFNCIETAKNLRSRLGGPYTLNCVVASEGVPQESKEFALKKPRGHVNFSEYPVIVDLAGREVYYYTGPIVRGILYEKFEREYIYGHFVIPMLILKDESV